jgi:alpha-tubulin suppressor-like RCC1 family protein
VLSACGRFHFDPLGGSAGDGPGGGDDGPPIDVMIPVAPPCNCTAIAAGASHTCVRLATGIVRCWGDNLMGQLGDGGTTPRPTPADVTGFADALDVIAGGNHNCVRRPGAVECWGMDVNGQVCNGAGAGGGTPSLVSGVTDAMALDAGMWHTCIVHATGAVDCCGLNTYGELGDGTNAGSRTSPTGVQNLTDAVGTAAGEYFNCFLRQAGGVSCTGNNTYGLGDGVSTSSNVIVSVTNMPPVTEVVAGREHMCARTDSGQVYCWGHNSTGELGDGSGVDQPTPVPIGISDAIALAAGQLFTCALRATGTMTCWGQNNSGQLGIGTMAGSKPVPVAVLGLSGITAIAAGDAHVCAIANGGLYCWGLNANGQVGDGTMAPRSLPTPITP